MRYREFITESQPTQEEMMELVYNIKNYCKPYLAANPNPLGELSLYRGIKNTDSSWAVDKEVRLSGRHPMDMGIESHDILNDLFTNEFGEPFRNALFVTGKVTVARAYTHVHANGLTGKAYVVLPKGPFTFLWSPIIEDLYSEIDENWYLPNDSGPTSDTYEELKKSVISTYRTTELSKAILSKHEVMLRCKSYYAIREDMAELLGQMLQ